MSSSAAVISPTHVFPRPASAQETHATVTALRGPSSNRPTRAIYWRRRIGVLVAVVSLALLLVAVVGQGADAELATPEVAGSAVVSPGDTLWDIAVTHAPAGEDPRAYLVRLEQLNGLGGASVPAWTVVLLPAR